jgi:precorrin-6B methylase 2
VLEHHRAWLSDRRRLDAFRAALGARVRPGGVVADIGAGTGVLALMAVDAGASRVYAIEREPIAAIGRRITSRHPQGSRIVFLRGDSSRVSLPERVDLVVSDLIGYFGFEAGLFEVLADARRRHLAPGGATIPSAIALHVAPVCHQGLRDMLDVWRSRPAGFDMQPAYEHARRSAHHLWLDPAAIVGEPLRVGRYELPADGPPTIAVEGVTRVVADSVIDGLCGWFDAELAPGVHVTNDPRAPHRIDRLALVLPIHEPFHVRRGTEIAISLRVLPTEHVIRWTATCRDVGGEARSFTASTFESVLIDREELARLWATPPRLSEEGQALKRVLALFDSGASRMQAEDALVVEFPSRFRCRKEAAAFVADALLKFTV